MRIWIIILLVICIPIYGIAISGLLVDYISAKKKGRDADISWSAVGLALIAPFFLIYTIARILGWFVLSYLSEVIEHGGFIKYYKWKKQKAIDDERERKEREVREKAEKEEWERIKNAYLAGEVTRTELPRVEDGKTCFEFDERMGLYVKFYYKVREIVYVEREYNERLNRFFQEHRDLRLYKMYKFIYIPHLCEDLKDGDLFHYFFPNANLVEDADLNLSSKYPIQYLVYPEDKSKIQHGMFFFSGVRDNHGARYIQGDYHPLYEGSDEEIIAQLDAIVKSVHNKHCDGALYCIDKRPEIEEGSTDDYADIMFYWETMNPEIAKLIKEFHEKWEKLKEYGLAENMLLNLLKEKQKLSRLVITKDFRLFLSDYNNMEIEMEPINKAVYLLFLNHPEGIVFKTLPDYRKELAEIYQKIKPFGLNERALQSIEDVTNPLLNSINEKCARIRGVFISKFDDSLAQHYYIYGMRGEAKKITLPRELVVWE